RAAHEQKLTAEQANAICAGLLGCFGLFGQFDIGLEFDHDAIERYSRRITQQGQLGTLSLVFGLAFAIFLQYLPRRINQDCTSEPIDNKNVAISNQTAKVPK